MELLTSVSNEPGEDQGVRESGSGSSTYHVVIVDQGTAEPPTLLLETAPIDFTANAHKSNASVASEIATWLATIHFR